jgi:hypothetical protein
VVGHVGHVGGEERLVLVADRCGHIRPPEEGLSDLGAVEQPHPRLDDGAVRAQPDAVHPLHAGERVVVGAPDGDGAIGFALDRDIRWQEGAGSVVLGPVEFHAARDPRAGQPHEGGLDHVVAVEDVVVGDLVVGHMDASAQFRHDHQPQPLILQVDRLPTVRGGDRADPLVERQRVHPAGRALVHPRVEIGGIGIRRIGQVAIDLDRLRPGGNDIRGEFGGNGGKDNSRP